MSAPNMIERFWAKVEIRGKNECWNWKASTFRRGYGKFWFKGKNRRAPRFIWQQLNGPIPKSIFVCHHCDNPRCVNPKHLFKGTHLDNEQDKIKKGRHKNQQKDFCSRGHPYNCKNTYITTAGWRICRVCAAAYQRRLRAKNRAI